MGGCADAGVLNADTLAAAVEALLSDCEREISTAYAEHLLTRLADVLRGKIVELYDAEDRRMTLSDELNAAQLRLEAQQRQYAQELVDERKATALVRNHLSMANEELGEVHEDLADMKACVRVLRRHIADLTAPPEEHS